MFLDVQVVLRFFCVFVDRLWKILGTFWIDFENLLFYIARLCFAMFCMFLDIDFAGLCSWIFISTAVMDCLREIVCFLF